MREILIAGFALATFVGLISTVSPASAEQMGGIQLHQTDGGYGYRDNDSGRGRDYGSDSYQGSGSRYSAGQNHCQYGCSDSHGKGYGQGYDKGWNNNDNGGYGKNGPIRYRPL